MQTICVGKACEGCSSRLMMFGQTMIAFWLLVICISFSKAAIPEEDGVLVLSQANFEEAIGMHDYILVEFCT